MNNSVDEALAGYATHRSVHQSDNSITVLWMIAVVSTGMHESWNMSAVELVLTKLHAEVSKFGGGGYKVIWWCSA